MKQNINRVKNLRHMSALVVALAISCSFAAISKAQENLENNQALDTIVINNESDDGVKTYVARQSTSAMKTDTPISKTPQTINIVTNQQMQDQAVQSVAEALRYSPGVFAEYRGASNLRDEVFVRGFSYVPIYLDGLLLSGDSSYAQINPYLLERVELISGPSSVLYGQTNPGGLVNAISKKPTDMPLREMELSIGNRDAYGLSFDLSDKVTKDSHFSYRLVGTGFTTDLQEQFARKKGFAIAPSLRWEPNAQTTLTILSGYQYEPKAGFRNFLEAAGTVKPINGYGYVPRNFFVSDPSFERFKRQQAWVGNEFEHEFNDIFTVRQKIRYHEIKMDQNLLVWGSLMNDPQTGLNTLISRVASSGRDEWKQFAGDNQLQAKFNTGDFEHIILAGIDSRYRKRSYVWQRNRNVPSISLTDPIYGDYDFNNIDMPLSSFEHLSARQTGIYLQDQSAFGRLNFMGGMRYDWANTNIDDYLNDKNYRYKDKAFTWRLGALYAFDNGISPYVSYSTSFEPSLTTPKAGQAAFDPVDARQIEVGIKYVPDSLPLALTAAYYDLTQKNIVQGSWNSQLAETLYQQIGKVHNKGFELSARGEVTQNFALIGSYSYVKSTIEETITASELDKTPSRIPQHQASLWANYDFNKTKLQGLKLGGGLRYIGKSWGDNQNTFEVDSTLLVDAMISFDFGEIKPELQGLSLQINGKNLSNKKYIASCANNFACFYGDGRTITASLKKTW
ncbi:TonB-dependent siderophore receptor [Bartonella sp. HY038]|uniref:TonB-dependent siderophore receptor n=1 Tax=Bartonella sp. HY038 TaxID=2759660 RepID=UPI0015FB2376|nr:TonB-dependent siderophore receptor [Bartonella sp. HY038]